MTEKSRELRKWSSSRKSAPIGCPVPKFSPENIQTSNIIWIEQVLFKHICVYTYMGVITIKQDHEFEGEGEVHMRRFGRRKGKGET